MERADTNEQEKREEENGSSVDGTGRNREEGTDVECGREERGVHSVHNLSVEGENGSCVDRKGLDREERTYGTGGKEREEGETYEYIT